METNATIDRDLTNSSLHRNIWYLALPMILEMSVLNMAQILDTLWVGKLGSAAMAAVTIVSVWFAAETHRSQLGE